LKIYWTLKSIPEYEDEDKSAIKQTLMPGYRKTYRHWQQWLVSIASVSYIIGFLVVPLDTDWLLQSAMSVILLLVLFVWSQVSIRLARPYIQEELRKRNEAGQVPAEAGNTEPKSTIKLVIGLLCLIVAAFFLLGAIAAYVNKGVTVDIEGQVLAIIISVVIPGGIGFYLVFSKR
jgi:FtsH-binding integral membrane protein